MAWASADNVVQIIRYTVFYIDGLIMSACTVLKNYGIVLFRIDSNFVLSIS
jgi:hypothetical protein